MTHRQRLALLATIIGSGVVFLDATIVNLALPNIGVQLGASFSGLQWVIEGYLLSLSALLLVGGSLGDIFGRKRIYLLGIIGFACMSLLSAIAPNIELLILFRVIQGAFGALLVPGALAIINTNFSSEQRGRAIGIWTGGTSAIGAAGPLVGGYLVDHGSWRWVFVIKIPLLVICYLLAKPCVQESKDHRPRRLDIPGALLVMLSFGGIIYGLIEGSALGWNSTRYAALIIGLMLLGVFLMVEKRSRDPMLELHLFRSRNFWASNLATFFMYGGNNAFFFIFIIHLQTVIGFSTFEAGLATLPVAIAIALLASRFGALAGKYGPRLFMTVGPLLIGIAILSMLQLHVGSSYLTVLPRLLLLGLGLAVSVAPLTNTVLASVDREYSGIASGTNNAVARIAGMVVIALLGLFGVSHAYKFGGLLCGGLAIAAGIVSWIWIKNKAPKALPIESLHRPIH